MLGLGGLIAGLIGNAADRQYSADADKEAVLNRDEKTVEKLDSALKSIEVADDVAKRERKEISDLVKKWKLENDYDGRLRDIHQNAMSELDEFKRSIDYYNRKQTIEDEAEDALEAFKESIEYDFEVSNLEDEIETAKNVYKKRSKLYELAGDSDDEISDTVSSLKKAEKDKMDSVVSKAQNKINEFKSKVSSEKTKIDRKKQADLRDLESELQTTKTRITKAENEAAELIRKEFNKADEAIRNEVYKKRTEAENKAIEVYQECMNVLEDQKKIDAQNAKNLYDSAKAAEKWANWFNKNGVPKWLVVGVGLLPFIPVGYLVIGYSKFLYQTVKAM